MSAPIAAPTATIKYRPTAAAANASHPAVTSPTVKIATAGAVVTAVKATVAPTATAAPTAVSVATASSATAISPSTAVAPVIAAYAAVIIPIAG